MSISTSNKKNSEPSNNSNNNRSSLRDAIDIDAPSLSLRTRLTGFFGSVLSGCLFAFLANAALSIGDVRSFAILYGIANIIFICGTGFIVGPMKQFSLMFTAERAMSTLIYLTATLAVILTALRGRVVLASILFFVQILSLVWYTLSYIPYAQELVSRCIGV